MAEVSSDDEDDEHVSIPQEMLDCHGPFDITLVVEDGIEINAHKQVLSKASEFFDKLLNGNMRESTERVIQLEMLTEADLRHVLEFVYSGNFQILTEDQAQHLYAVAEYLFLQGLQKLCEDYLTSKLNISNCISTYSFAQMYRSEKLLSFAKQFIISNFTTVAKEEEFLNLSIEAIKVWISSDEINIHAEEDVYRIIVAWVERDINERMEYFAELLSLVRLVYISRDYLVNHIATSDIVRESESCFRLVRNIINSIDRGNPENALYAPPRKSLETTVIVSCIQKGPEQLLCYYPCRKRWFKSRNPSLICDQVISSRGKLYFISKHERTLLRYDPFFDQWKTLSVEGTRELLQFFVSDEGDMYSLELDIETSCSDCASLPPPKTDRHHLEGMVNVVSCGKQHLSCITKYDHESNRWKQITSFDLGSRKGICFISNADYIYLIGGINRETNEILSVVNRYNLRTNKWEKVADIQEGRERAYGVASQGKIFITGGSKEICVSTSCEMYNENTNKWHSIASRRMPRRRGSMICADNKLYVVDGYVWNERGFRGKIECYDAEEDEWSEVTEIPVEQGMYTWYLVNSCKLRLFKGTSLRWKPVTV